jgi:hypothetical protein
MCLNCSNQGRTDSLTSITVASSSELSFMADDAQPLFERCGPSIHIQEARSTQPSLKCPIYYEVEVEVQVEVKVEVATPHVGIRMARSRRSWVKRCDVRLSAVRSYHTPVHWSARANATFFNRAQYQYRARKLKVVRGC